MLKPSSHLGNKHKHKHKETMFTHVKQAQENEKYACAKWTECVLCSLLTLVSRMFHTGEINEISIS